MARLQWCRKHIKEVAEACDLSRRTVEEVNQAAKFCDEHGDFSPLPTKPIIALIRIPDEQIRERAISSALNVLKSGKHPITGKFLETGRITEREMKKIIEHAEIEVRKEMMEKIRAERKENESNGSVVKDITQEEVDKLLGVTSEPNPKPIPNKNSRGDIIYSKEDVERIRLAAPLGLVISTITRKEIDIYFDVMKKILCTEDIPKHKKRIEIMIANDTLLIVA